MDNRQTDASRQTDVEALFRKAGVLREGHFLLTSGLHSPVYWEKFRILQYRSIRAYSAACSPSISGA
jgi:orotate phosphoribosyltransferase